jgi:hypothetical protein
MVADTGENLTASFFIAIIAAIINPIAFLTDGKTFLD